MAYPPRDTVAGIINAIQAEFSLQSSVTDATGLNLTALINSAGRELVLTYPWQQLSRDFTVTLTGLTGEYDLPDDWEYFEDQTQWDSTNHWPLMGPTSAQEWKWVNEGNIGVAGPRIRYRVRANKFQVFPSTETSTLSMEYISGMWVESTDGSEEYRTVQNSDNVVRLDPFLLQKYAKLKFWETKGFDTTAFKDDFLRVYFGLIGKDKGAPVLNLSRRPNIGLLTVNNVPDGNWNT